MHAITIRSSYYQAFDIDVSLEVPAESCGGWKQAELTFDRDRMALVVMHALDVGTAEESPWLYCCTEYLGRARQITQTVLPGLLAAVRAAGTRAYHVVPGGVDCGAFPGYQRALQLAGPRPSRPRIQIDDPLMQAVEQFKADHAMPGAHNWPPRDRKIQFGFPEQATPVGEEGVVETSEQLLALCQADGINHLVYCGFAINECIMVARGGMVDLGRYGLMCSAVRQAVTAIENKESARTQAHKEQALWQVAHGRGFVFDLDDFVQAIR